MAAHGHLMGTRHGHNAILIIRMFQGKNEMENLLLTNKLRFKPNISGDRGLIDWSLKNKPEDFQPQDLPLKK